jgi:hypothetical protein
MSDDDPVEVGKRLRRIRHAFGPSPVQHVWLEWVGIDKSVSAWTEYESGARLPAIEDVQKIVRKIPGMTSDYILFGTERSLYPAAEEQIRAWPYERLGAKRGRKPGRNNDSAA